MRATCKLGRSISCQFAGGWCQSDGLDKIMYTPRSNPTLLYYCLSPCTTSRTNAPSAAALDECGWPLRPLDLTSNAAPIKPGRQIPTTILHLLGPCPHPRKSTSPCRALPPYCQILRLRAVSPTTPLLGLAAVVTPPSSSPCVPNPQSPVTTPLSCTRLP